MQKNNEHQVLILLCAQEISTELVHFLHPR